MSTPPSNGTGLNALQAGVWQALHENVSVDGATIPVYDFVPQDTEAPYVQLGDFTGVPYLTQDRDGLEARFVLHAYSHEQGSRHVHAIGDAINTLLDRARLTLTGWALVWVRLESFDSFRDADGYTYHGVATYRAWIQKE